MELGVLTRGQIEHELSRLVARYHAQAAYLFGSYARGEAAPESDIDVVIDGGEGFRPFDVFAIAEELFRAFGKRVDVYELREIEPESEFAHTLLQERVRVA